MSVPVFLDNAERINDFNIPEMDCQLIALSVTEDPVESRGILMKEDLKLLSSVQREGIDKLIDFIAGVILYRSGKHKIPWSA